LDDATSSVDPTKEHEIRAALREVMTGRTTLIIAHRPATIALADRVVLVDGGRVAAEGTHDELLETSERYREVLAQAAAMEAAVPGERAGGAEAAGRSASTRSRRRSPATRPGRCCGGSRRCCGRTAGASPSRSCCSSARRRASWPARRSSGTASTTAYARTMPAP